MKITIETTVCAPISEVWDAWTTPSDIVRWNYAVDDWKCPKADLELKPGGKFNYRMEAKDGSMGFDFEGTFTEVVPNERIAYRLGDEREVVIEFKEVADGVQVSETFDAEDEHSGEQQRQGWQAILENFKRHVESSGD